MINVTKYFSDRRRATENIFHNNRRREWFDDEKNKNKIQILTSPINNIYSLFPKTSYCNVVCPWYFVVTFTMLVADMMQQECFKGEDGELLKPNYE